MLGSKLDIFKKEWLDVVFSGRNKAYGAYTLRQGADADTTKSLFIGVVLFDLAIGSPFIAQFVKANGADDTEDRMIDSEVVLAEPPSVDKAAPPPPLPIEPPPPRVDQVRMPPPVVVKAELVQEEPPSVDELKKADPGPKTIAGDPTAAIRIDLPVGEGPKDQEVTESVGINHIFVAVEVAPTPQGGMD